MYVGRDTLSMLIVLVSLAGDNSRAELLPSRAQQGEGESVDSCVRGGGRRV